MKLVSTLGLFAYLLSCTVTYAQKYRTLEANSSSQEVEVDAKFSRSSKHLHWQLRAKEGERIRISFRVIKTNFIPVCDTVLIKIYDGSSDDKREIGRWCDEDNLPFYSWSNKMFIKVTRKRKKADQHPLFLTYVAEKYVPCQKNITINDTTEGNLSSPGYPKGYNESLECRWNLQLPLYQRKFSIRLQFTVDLNETKKCWLEYVAAYAFSSPTGPKVVTLCGNDTKNLVFYLPSLLIVFRTSSKHLRQHSGFNLVYQVVKDEELEERVRIGSKYSELGTISSPYYPLQYPSFQRRSYLLESMMSQRVIHLDVRISHLSSNCTQEYVTVFDGRTEDAPMLGKWCYFAHPSFRSTGGNLYVVFRSWQNSGNTGFIANYKLEKCEKELDAVQSARQFHYSVAQPFLQMPVHCTWTIRAVNRDHRVIVHFTFVRVDCRTSRVTVIDMFRLRHQPRYSGHDFCGREDHMYLSGDAAMDVKVVSSGTLTYPLSFYMEYRSRLVGGCDGNPVIAIAYSRPLLLKSPGYPGRCPDHVNCMWRIERNEPKGMLVLKVDYGPMDGNPDCSDKIQFYEAKVSGLTTPDKVVCAMEPATFRSAEKFVTITFTSGSRGGARAFTISYVLQTEPESSSVIDNSPVIAAVAGTIGVVALIVIVIIVCCVVKRRNSENRNRSHYTAPPVEESTTPMMTVTESPANSPDQSNSANAPPSYGDVVDEQPEPSAPILPDHSAGPSVEPSPSLNESFLQPSAPELPPPSYEDAVSKGFIIDTSETRM